VEKMRKNAFNENEHIMKEEDKKGISSNGSLIRCMPLIIYGIRLQPDQTFNLMRLDSSLTHASYLVYYAVTAYALTAQYLIRHPFDEERHKKSVEYCLTFLENRKSVDMKYFSAIEEVERWIKRAITVAKKDLNNSREPSYGTASVKLDEFQQFHSHIKVSFERAFYHLYKGNTFKDAMRETMKVGGNADSNCCVVGGLMGAYHGLKVVMQNDKQKKSYLEIIEKWDHPEKKKKEQRAPYQAKLYSQYLPILLKFPLHPKKFKLEDSTIGFGERKKEEFVL